MTVLALILTGLLIGIFGTLIGVGGGFIMMPVLLFMFPGEPPEVLTAISLAVIFLNSVSGASAYARGKRINYRAGMILAAASVPGTIAGATLVSMISRRSFEPIFGLLLILAGGFIFFKPLRGAEAAHEPARPWNERVRWPVLVAISLAVGFISSFVGIGGGIIHVPMLIHLFEFPVRIATATSQFVLAIMSLVGAGVHLLEGTLQPHLEKVLYLGVPAVIGAQIGAALSKKMKDVWIVRVLAAAIVLAGIRLLLTQYQF